MADALLSAVVNQLVSSITKMAEHEVKLVKGVSDAIENLKKNLAAIRVVLKDSEKKQWRDEAVKLWMDDLKDISCDMDDVLDEWGTAILKAEIDKDEREIASFERKFKVRFSALCRCFHSGPLGRLRHRRDIGHKIEKLNERLDSITTRKDKFNFSLTTRIVEPLRSAVTTSIIDVSKVFGQDAYVTDLRDRLLCEGSEEGGKFCIIPIVGMGGIGKTTLAKMVYNDDQVKRHFDKRVWICVSDTFDIVSIASAIIEQLTGQAPSFSGLETLMQKLVESIKDAKNFLIVLDDVWTDNYQQWEQLETQLLCGSIGSRVIVTTRKVEVVRMMGVGEHMMIRLNKLSDENCRLLFSEIAFFGRAKEDQGDLEEIGREIARKCDGLPLAAKTLGSLLRIKGTSKNEWLNVLQSEIWRLEKVRENLFYPLLLSYFDLSPVEKRCFSHCALFPKDHEIDRDELISLWMAQGLFNLQKNVEEEAVEAERCFENLAMRSFFQDFEYRWEGYIGRCKMHDVVHDFAQFVTSNEYAALEMVNIREKDDLSARHLTIIVPYKQHILTTPLLISNKKNLQSIMFAGGFLDVGAIDCCFRFTSLRTLILRIGLTKSVPESIGDLVHLRYLSLSGTFDSVIGQFRNNAEFRKLPDTLGQLCNLQTLILKGFHAPEVIAKLINLRTLECELRSFPKGIGRMTNLQTLTGSSWLTENNVNEKFPLEDLGSLNYLRRLRLWGLGTDQGHVGGATQARLHQKSYLVSLTLFFETHHEDNFETHQIILEALQPPPNLKLLDISGYGNAVFPSWMTSSSTKTLEHLKVLCLTRWSNCETLPPLGNLPSLEELVIWNFRKVKKVGPEFLGISDLEEECNSIFPRLKKLRFTLMNSWWEWVGIPGWKKESTHIRILPCLECLEIFNCRELRALPEFLEMTPLKELHVSFSPFLEEEIGKLWAKAKFRDVSITKFGDSIMMKEKQRL